MQRLSSAAPAVGAPVGACVGRNPGDVPLWLAWFCLSGSHTAQADFSLAM